MNERNFHRPAEGYGFAERRGPKAPQPAPADSSWRKGLPAIAAEHRGSLADAEADAAYRWAAQLVEGKDVLDVGSGPGHGAATFQRAGARSVIGVDPDRDAVEVATRLYGERLRFATAEPEALPFASGSFDVVTCFSALENALDPEGMLGSLGRLLAPGGVLVASLPLAPRVPREENRLVEAPELPDWESLARERFGHARAFSRRVCLGSMIQPRPPEATDDAEAGAVQWLGSEPSEDRSLLLVAGDAEIAALEPAATLVGGRDLRSYRETVEAWQYRARRAEAEGAAKHWELVASREAQRRLRKRLWDLEHRPLRKLFRVLRGRPAKLGQGPRIRPPEREQESWN